MNQIAVIILVVLAVAVVIAMLSVRIVRQFESGVMFRLGRVRESKEPGLRLITRDNVSVDVSAVAYFRAVDPVKSVVAIEDVYSAIDLEREKSASDTADLAPVVSAAPRLLAHRRASLPNHTPPVPRRTSKESSPP